MIDNLINIPGPVFLIVFIVYAVVIIWIIKRYVSKDYSCHFDIPEPTTLEPLDIAILANGVNGAIITSMFNLWRLKGANISTNKNSILLKQNPTDTSKFNKLEKAIYNYIQQPKYYYHLYEKSSLKSIDKILQPNKTRLQEMHLASDSRVIFHHWKGILLGVVSLIGFGGLKLYYGVVRDKPFGLLLILLILSIIALFMVIKPTKITTSALGKKLLDKSQQRFEWLKTSKNGAVLLMDDTLLYGIAIFGISSFISSELGGLLKKPALLDQSSSSSIYGSGSGCSGCGGGGCGGGCGGCGGG